MRSISDVEFNMRGVNDTGTYSLPHIIRMNRLVSMIFSVFLVSCILIYLIGVLNSILNNNYSYWIGWLLLAVIIVFFVFLWSMVSALQTQLLEDKMVFKNLYTTNEMAYSDMSEMKYILRNLIIMNNAGGYISIPYKNMSKKNLSIIFDVLRTKAPQIKINDSVDNFFYKY